MHNSFTMLLIGLLVVACSEPSSNTSVIDGDGNCTGQEGCACYGNDTCDGEFSCVDGICMGCEENDRQCYGTNVQICDDNGRWEFYRDCDPDCCEDGQCVGCSSVDGDNNDSETGGIEIAPKVIVLPTDVADTSYMDDGFMVIPKAAARRKSRDSLHDLNRLAAEMLLVGEKHPDGQSAGLFWRLEQVQDQGDAWRIQRNALDSPTLEEVFKKGSFGVLKNVPFRRLDRKSDNEKGFMDSIGIKCSGAAEVNTTFNVELGFQPVFEMEVDIDWFTLQYLRGRFAGEFDANVNLIINGNISNICSGEIELLSAPFDIVAIVGGVPVVVRITPSITLEYEVGAHGNLNVDVSAGRRVEVGLEIVYDNSSNGWQPVNPIAELSTPNPAATTISLNFEANAQAWMDVQVSAMLYGMAGAYFGVKPTVGLNVEMHPDNELYWDLYWQNSFYAGCELTVLGETLTGKEWPDIWQDGDSFDNGCVTGACCEQLHILSDSDVCNDNLPALYRCSPVGCGGIPQQQVGSQYCNGSNAACMGETDTQWNDLDTCEDYELCSADEYGASCQEDLDSCDLCNGHGAWTGDSCNCSDGYNGTDCAQCDDGYTGYPNCHLDCSGHGIWTGSQCDCDEHFDGANCEKCEPGYVDWPRCIEGRWAATSEVIVTDRETGKMWLRDLIYGTGSCVDSSCSIEEAEAYCANLNLEGFSDWRLPTIDELRSIVEGCDRNAEGGDCQVSDPGCLSANTDNGCWTQESCDSCTGRDCFWDENVWRGFCYATLSSSIPSEYSDRRWRMSFSSAHMWVTTRGLARCVRNP